MNKLDKIKDDIEKINNTNIKKQLLNLYTQTIEFIQKSNLIVNMDDDELSTLLLNSKNNGKGSSK